MPPKSSPSKHPEPFRSALLNLVDRRHPLVRLAALIDWDLARSAASRPPFAARSGGAPASSP